MVPFLYGLKLVFSVNSTKRKIGSGLMTVFVVVYNIGLYQATRDVYFGFREGKVLKWYAITPEGVRFFDRAGVEPNYGISLKPVTPEVIRNLKVIEKGDFRTIDPARVAWFNPITGDPQLWYYQYPDRTIEFYNKPGYHPFMNEPLQPVTKEIYVQWRERAKTNMSSETTQAAAPDAAVIPSRPATQVMSRDSGGHTGAIVPRARSLALDSSTARIIVTSTTDIAKTKAIEELLSRSIDGATSARAVAEQQQSSRTAKPLTQSTTAEQFEFRVSSCRLVGDVLTCRVLLTNIGQDRHLSLHQSRFLDENSNESRAPENTHCVGTDCAACNRCHIVPIRCLRTKIAQATRVDITVANSEPQPGSQSLRNGDRS